MCDLAVLILLLEQGDRSLEDHTENFVFLANYTSYPDSWLCSFFSNWTEHLHTRAVIRGWSSKEPHRIHRVGAGILQVETHLGHRGCWHQSHSGPRAWSITTPQCGAARTHRRQRARACRGRWAIAIRSDRAANRPGARAPSVWPGARADNSSNGGNSCRDRGGYGTPRPLHHHWWWA